MGTIKQKSTFEGGLDKDTSPESIKNNRLLDAVNMDNIGDGKYSKLQNIKGTTEVIEYLPAGYDTDTLNVLGVYEVKANYDYDCDAKFEKKHISLLIFSYDANSGSVITLIDLVDNVRHQLYPNTTDNTDLAFPPLGTVDASYTEERGTPQIFWDDFKNVLRSLNLNISCSPTLPPPSLRELEVRKRYAGGQPNLVGIEQDGVLLAGTYQFAFRLYNTNSGNSSDVSLFCNPISVAKSDCTTVNYDEQLGGELGEVINKKIVLSIDLTSEAVYYNAIQLYVIKNTDGLPLPSNVVYQTAPNTDWYNNPDRIIYSNIGIVETTIPVENVVTEDAGIEYAKTQVIKDNRLFRGNVKYYDRTNDRGSVSVESAETIKRDADFKCGEESNRHKGYFRREVYPFGIAYHDEYMNFGSVEPFDLSKFFKFSVKRTAQCIAYSATPPTVSLSDTSDLFVGDYVRYNGVQARITNVYPLFISIDTDISIIAGADLEILYSQSGNNTSDWAWKFPDRSDPKFTIVSDTDIPQSIGLTLKGIKNHPKWAKGFVIVRQKRIKNVLYQSPHIPTVGVLGVPTQGVGDIRTLDMSRADYKGEFDTIMPKVLGMGMAKNISKMLIAFNDYNGINVKPDTGGYYCSFYSYYRNQDKVVDADSNADFQSTLQLYGNEIPCYSLVYNPDYIFNKSGSPTFYESNNSNNMLVAVDAIAYRRKHIPYNTIIIGDTTPVIVQSYSFNIIGIDAQYAQDVYPYAFPGATVNYNGNKAVITNYIFSQNDFAFYIYIDADLSIIPGTTITFNVDGVVSSNNGDDLKQVNTYQALKRENYFYNSEGYIQTLSGLKQYFIMLQDIDIDIKDNRIIKDYLLVLNGVEQFLTNKPFNSDIFKHIDFFGYMQKLTEQQGSQGAIPSDTKHFLSNIQNQRSILLNTEKKILDFTFWIYEKYFNQSINLFPFITQYTDRIYKTNHLDADIGDIDDPGIGQIQGTVTKKLPVLSTLIDDNQIAGGCYVVNNERGLSDSRYSRISNEWVFTGTYVALSDADILNNTPKDVDVWGGDCFVSKYTVKINNNTQRVSDVYDNIQAEASDYDGLGVTNNKIEFHKNTKTGVFENNVEFLELYIESETNTNYHQEKNEYPAYKGDQIANYSNPYFYRYNGSYSVNNDSKVFVSREAETFTVNRFYYPARIVYSDQRLYQADGSGFIDTDGFSRFAVLNRRDLDEQYGQIIKLIDFGTQKLNAIQEHKVRIEPIGVDRVESGDNKTLVLGTASVIGNGGYYLPFNNGSQHIRSVKAHNGMCYFIDAKKQQVISFSDGAFDFISEQDMITYFKNMLFNDTAIREIDLSGYIDATQDNMEYIISKRSHSSTPQDIAVFNAKNKRFKTRIDIGDDVILNGVYAGQQLHLLNKNKIYTAYTNNQRGLWFGNYRNSSFKFVVNDYPGFVKIFNVFNFEMKGGFIVNKDTGTAFVPSISPAIPSQVANLLMHDVNSIAPPPFQMRNYQYWLNRIRNINDKSKLRGDYMEVEFVITNDLTDNREVEIMSISTDCETSYRNR